KTPGTRATRIHVNDARAFRPARLVRMTTDDNVELSRGGIKIKLLNVVQHVYQNRARFNDGRDRQLRGPITFVNVPPNSNNWSNRTQRFNDRKIADIAGMDDEIGPR